MKKRMLALVMTLAMCLSLLPVSALAAEGDKVAQIGETQYETLDAAIAAAQDGDTIELLADCTTGGIDLSKNLTIQAATGLETKPTITFENQGIALRGKELTFKNCNVTMTGIGTTPVTAEWNWMTICASKDASLTLNNVTMTMDGDGTPVSAKATHAIYFCSNNKLNLINGSNLTIKNYEQDALEWDGGDGGYNVNITDSSFTSDNNRSGFTGTFYATIENSTVNVVNSTGNGSNGSHFIIKKKSTVNFNNNHAHGLSAGILTIDNSTVTANNNGANGIHVTGELSVSDKSQVTIKENGCSISSKWTIPGALYVGAEGTITNSTVTIQDNCGSGIYQKAGTLTIDPSADVTIMKNVAEKLGIGGGIYANGIVQLPNNVKLYNNHASAAGDDICSTGTITFGSVGSGWVLDGAPDCTDAIDGWYVDGENDRWSAHKKPVHVEEFTAGAAITASTEKPLALKAAHGLIPLDPGDSGTENWAISKSKTATNLDKNYESKVTLSLPAAEESFGPSFMSYLADGEEVSFDAIQNDIIYLLDAGSKVEDYIGYKENDYNFDFVNDASKLTLKVGDVTYPAEKIAENQYGFCPFASIASETDGEIAPAQYAYVLTYVPGNLKDTEHFVWDINVPVSNFAPVQLTYTVKLTNPQTSAGTYGQYDADGSKNYSGLYTNNSATLYPVDSNGDKGVPENFPKPTVSYTISGGSSGGGGGGGSVKPPVLNTKDHYGYIIGYPVDYITGETTNDQTRMPVKPEGNITRAEVATIFFRMLTDDSRNQFWSQSSEYSDVKTSDWFNNAICTLSNAGILSGYDDGTFAPNGKITRAEFATIASRFFEYKDSEGNNPFNDVDENSWYYQYILAASQMGLINGYPDGTFQPNSYITRAEAVTIVNRTLDRHPDQDHFLKDMLVWVDNMDTSKWYYADMQEATNSHEYEMKGSGDSKYENWTKMLEIRDWAAFERAWSDANSASGGEVTK